MKNIFKKKQPKLYTSCNVLPIHNFNEVANNDDYNFLKRNIDDVVSLDILQKTWLGILDEFIRISKNNIAIATLKKKTQLILLDKKLQVFEAIKINIHYQNDVTEVCKDYRVNPLKINAHIGLVKNDIARISNGMKSNDGGNNKSETEFDLSIAICSKNGFQINRFTTVVSEWVQFLNLIEKQNEKK